MMKRFIIILAVIPFALTTKAQTDTSQKKPADTIHVGNMIIIKGAESTGDGTVVHITRRKAYHPDNVSTNWLILDIGFANYNDKTNYSSAAAQQFAPGSTANWFDLRTGKSVDVNIWLFLQRLNVVQHVINLKYGLGVELNNYRYKNNIKYATNPTSVFTDSISYSKNKLAADYVTVPLMLNFNFTPHRKNGFGISVGASAGYLYSSRQKLISSEFGKKKTHDDFDLQPWKISWIGEVQLGPVKLYGSYATKSMFKRGLDQVPYTVGIRFSNW